VATDVANDAAAAAAAAAAASAAAAAAAAAGALRSQVRLSPCIWERALNFVKKVCPVERTYPLKRVAAWA
jgi:hypothetical protein